MLFFEQGATPQGALFRQAPFDKLRERIKSSGGGFAQGAVLLRSVSNVEPTFDKLPSTSSLRQAQGAVLLRSVSNVEPTPLRGPPRNAPVPSIIKTSLLTCFVSHEIKHYKYQASPDTVLKLPDVIESFGYHFS